MSTKHIDILFLSPPAVDFPQFVEAQNNDGSKLDVGKWMAPDNESPYWRLRLRVDELVLKLVAPEMDVPVIDVTTTRHIRHNPPLVDPGAVGLPAKVSPAQDRRALLKEKIAGLNRKSTATAIPPPPNTMLAPMKCPSCEITFDKAKDDLVACIKCGEDKCTAQCITNTLEPCKDCQALVPDADEGFDPSAVPDDAPGLREAVARDVKEGRGDAAGKQVFSTDWTPETKANAAKKGNGTEDDEDEE